MSTKASNPRCEINFGNLTFRILVLQKLPGLQEICMILGLNPDSVLGSLSSKHLQATLFTVYLHDLGIKSRFSSRALILQTTWFTAYLHDLGTTVNLDSVFGS